MNTETLYGVHSVRESLKAGRRTFFGIYVKKERLSERTEEIISFARKLNIPIHSTGAGELKKLTGTDSHQGLAATVSPYPVVRVDDLMARGQKENGHPFFLLLDNIVDPQNLGALIRTALCVGVTGIIVPKDRSARLTPAVSRSSAGALEHSLISAVTNLSVTVNALKEKDIWIAGLERGASQSAFEADLNVPLGIIIGSEEKGIRPLVKKSCDFLISIPQAGAIDSLNASAAGAVVMYEAYRQRNVLKGA